MRTVSIGLAAAVVLFTAECSSSMMDSELATQLMSVSPPGGAAAVAPGSNIVLTCNRAMMAGMEQYVALHLGGPSGPSVPMGSGWMHANGSYGMVFEFTTQ